MPGIVVLLNDRKSGLGQVSLFGEPNIGQRTTSKSADRRRCIVGEAYCLTEASVFHLASSYKWSGRDFSFIHPTLSFFGVASEDVSSAAAH